MISAIQNQELQDKVQHLIDNKTKPPGSLGTLEEVALQISLIQQTEQPSLKNPTILVFAGDHGIATKGEVNPYPQEVTAQMVLNFLRGGAAINVFCKQHDITLKIADAGVNYDFEKTDDLLHIKINKSTKNYQEAPAMSFEEYQESIRKGGEQVQQIYDEGCNCIGFGEMGIANTSSASLLMAYFLKEPIDHCVGAGTGLNYHGIQKKKEILYTVYNKYRPHTPAEALQTFGGFEIVMITGAILKAAELGMVVMIDGFIVTAALLGAYALNKNCLDYCIATHTSNESGHEKMLTFLGKKPLLDLGLRLGEGTGVALAYPLLQSSLLFLTEMASFESAQVSNAQK